MTGPVGCSTSSRTMPSDSSDPLRRMSKRPQPTSPSPARSTAWIRGEPRPAQPRYRLTRPESRACRATTLRSSAVSANAQPVPSGTPTPWEQIDVPRCDSFARSVLRCPRTLRVGEEPERHSVPERPTTPGLVGRACTPTRQISSALHTGTRRPREAAMRRRPPPSRRRSPRCAGSRQRDRRTHLIEDDCTTRRRGVLGNESLEAASGGVQFRPQLRRKSLVQNPWAKEAAIPPVGTSDSFRSSRRDRHLAPYSRAVHERTVDWDRVLNSDVSGLDQVGWPRCPTRYRLATPKRGGRSTGLPATPPVRLRCERVPSCPALPIRPRLRRRQRPIGGPIGASRGGLAGSAEVCSMGAETPW